MQLLIEVEELYNLLADMDSEERGKYLLIALANLTAGISKGYPWVASQVSTIEQPKKTRQTNTGFYTPEFEEFWKAYPPTRKTGKGAAFTAWKKIKMDKSFLLSACLFALNWQKESKSWKEGYVPMPATYLNQRRFEDEPEVTTSEEKYLDMNGVWQVRKK